jgi:hypothetical protein
MTRFYFLLIVLVSCKAPVKLAQDGTSSDCFVSIQKHTGHLSGIDALEEFQKSRFDFDFIIIEETIGSQAHWSSARLYLDSAKWFFKNSEHFYEVFLNRDDTAFIGELPIDATFTDFTCRNPSRNDRHYYMFFSKKGIIQRLESNRPLDEVVISESNHSSAMKTLQAFNRLEKMVVSVRNK